MSPSFMFASWIFISITRWSWEFNFICGDESLISAKIFNEIKKLKPGQGNEIHITDAIRNLINKGNNFYGNIFMGKYLDCGTISGYIQSSIQISKGKKWNYAWSEQVTLV